MRSVYVVYSRATAVVLLLKLGGNEVFNPANPAGAGLQRLQPVTFYCSTRCKPAPAGENMPYPVKVILYLISVVYVK
jgi:hypothetical protein